MSGALIEVRDLARRFGDVHAVNGVSFDLAKGQVAGLIGANGAGKTTTMKILATLDLPDEGYVRLGGVDVVDCPGHARQRVGWMPDHFTPYKEVTVCDYLDFFGRAYGLRGAALHARVAEVMDFTELASLKDRFSDRLSKGQTQRLCLARTLLNDPEFLILDEPAAGLDPKARIEFKNLVRLLRDQGKTLLISSHILSELGEMCDTLIFMDAGRVMHHGDADSLQQQTGTSACAVEITVAGPVEPLLAWLAVRPGWGEVRPGRTGARAEFHVADLAALAAELKRLLADGIVVAEFHREERRLEDAFVDMLNPGRRRAVPPPLPPVQPPSP